MVRLRSGANLESDVVHVGRRVSKKPRLLEADGQEGNEGNSAESRRRRRPELSSELWALVLEFVHYSAVMQCTAVSPLFLREVLPKIQVLCFDSYRQLDRRQARRFSQGCVDTILISCFFSDEEGICEETATRAVPFLTNFSSTLRTLVLGSHCHILYGAEICTFRNFRRFGREPDRWRELVHGLIRSFCGAFLMGQLRLEQIFGMLESQKTCAETSDDAADCTLCLNICQTFPLVYGVPYATATNCICLSAQRRLDIVASRDGGKETIQSPYVLTNILKNFQSAFFKYDVLVHARPQFSVRVLPNALIELLELLVSFGADPSKVSQKEFFMGLRQGQELKRFPIFESSFQHLVRLKFPIDERDVVIISNEPTGLCQLLNEKKNWKSCAKEPYIVLESDL